MANMFINAMVDVWTNGATVYNAIKMTVTDSASADGSKVINLIGGSSGTTDLFSVNKSGNVAAAGTVTATGGINNTSVGASTRSTGLFTTLGANGAVTFSSGGSLTGTFSPSINGGATFGTALLGYAGMYLSSGGFFTWTNPAGTPDLTVLHSANLLTLSGGDLAITTAGATSASVVTVGGTQTLTGKTLTTPTINGATTSGTFTGTGAFTGGVTGTTGTFSSTVSGGTIVQAQGGASGNVHFWLKGNGNTDRFVIYADTTAGNVSMRLNGTTTWTFDIAGGLTIPGSIQASGTNIFLGDGGSGRKLQFQNTYYLDWNVSDGSLRWVGNNTQLFHISNASVFTVDAVSAASGTFSGQVNCNSMTFLAQCIGTNTTVYFQNGGSPGTVSDSSGGVVLRPCGNVDTHAAVLRPSGTLHLTDIAEASDETLKSDWEPRTRSVTDDVAKLEIGSFTWKSGGHRGYGVMAQALARFMPEVVSGEAEEGTLGVNYGKAALTAIIDASKRIVALEARIAELEGKG